MSRKPADGKRIPRIIFVIHGVFRADGRSYFRRRQVRGSGEKRGERHGRRRRSIVRAIYAFTFSSSSVLFHFCLGVVTPVLSKSRHHRRHVDEHSRVKNSTRGYTISPRVGTFRWVWDELLAVCSRLVARETSAMDVVDRFVDPKN